MWQSELHCHPRRVFFALPPATFLLAPGARCPVADLQPPGGTDRPLPNYHTAVLVTVSLQRVPLW